MVACQRSEGQSQLQKWLNRALSRVHGRHPAPVINADEFIAHHCLPLFCLKFCNQIKVKEAKDERERKPEEGRGGQEGEAGAMVWGESGGGEQNRALRWEGWALLIQMNGEGRCWLVFQAFKMWENRLFKVFSCCTIMCWCYFQMPYLLSVVLVHVFIFSNPVPERWFWDSEVPTCCCSYSGIQKEWYPKAVLEYAVTRFYCRVLVWDQLNMIFIWFVLEIKQSGSSDASWGQYVFFDWRVFCLCLTSSFAVVWNFISNPNGIYSFTQALYILSAGLFSRIAIFPLCERVCSIKSNKKPCRTGLALSAAI